MRKMLTTIKMKYYEQFKNLNRFFILFSKIMSSKFVSTLAYMQMEMFTHNKSTISLQKSVKVSTVVV